MSAREYKISFFFLSRHKHSYFLHTSLRNNKSSDKKHFADTMRKFAEWKKYFVPYHPFVQFLSHPSCFSFVFNFANFFFPLAKFNFFWGKNSAIEPETCFHPFLLPRHSILNLFIKVSVVECQRDCALHNVSKYLKGKHWHDEKWIFSMRKSTQVY